MPYQIGVDANEVTLKDTSYMCAATCTTTCTAVVCSIKLVENIVLFFSKCYTVTEVYQYIFSDREELVLLWSQGSKVRDPAHI